MLKAQINHVHTNTHSKCYTFEGGLKYLLSWAWWCALSNPKTQKATYSSMAQITSASYSDPRWGQHSSIMAVGGHKGWHEFWRMCEGCSEE